MARDLFDRNTRAKAGGEWLVALALSVALLPLGLLIAAAIALEAAAAGERPQVLVGEPRRSAGRTFRLLKFRTFRTSAWREHLARAPGTSIKALERRPEALTRTGRLLKRTYLDELPQLLNVLRGEMALVGVRRTSHRPGATSSPASTSSAWYMSPSFFTALPCGSNM